MNLYKIKTSGQRLLSHEKWSHSLDTLNNELRTELHDDGWVPFNSDGSAQNLTYSHLIDLDWGNDSSKGEIFYGGYLTYKKQLVKEILKEFLS